MSTSLSINPPSFSIITTTPSSPSSFSSSSFSTSSSSYTSVSPRLLIFILLQQSHYPRLRQARFSPSEGTSRLRRRTLAAKGDMTITEMREKTKRRRVLLLRSSRRQLPGLAVSLSSSSLLHLLGNYNWLVSTWTPTDGYFKYVSGYKNRFQNFIRYLREMGDEVMVVTTHEGVPQEFYGAKLIGSRSFPCPWYRKVPLSLALSPRIISEVARFKPDIIHASSPGIMVIF
ncbi:Sulfoquinovosyl transferase SQD2 [Vitis vinifera]|uniref:Sulfoquinovosyl transferase SQD2 n=1 Tax=Vitis vinifera TaxID=29760 RepID=A0A438JAY4_VITVI|nr:Sulfoquinovosyl transferase SQD2 [Vitis vinifera]